MAELFGAADGRQWRKYAGDGRAVSAPTLFFAMARLELSPEELERVLDRMRQVGADITLEEKQ